MTQEMIVEHLPRVATGPSKMVSLTPTTVFKAQDIGTFTNVLSQAQIIHKLYSDCPYNIGDVVRPEDDALFMKEGAYRITGIASTISEWKGTEYNKPWPKNNNPMIVDAWNVLTGAPIHATTNYFRKFLPHEESTFK